MQRNWIGRSYGVEFRLPVAGREGTEIPVYTTRVDTVFGMTYVVLAPEHPLVDELVSGDKIDEVRAYQEQARRTSEIRVRYFVPTYASCTLSASSTAA